MLSRGMNRRHRAALHVSSGRREAWRGACQSKQSSLSRKVRGGVVRQHQGGRGTGAGVHATTVFHPRAIVASHGDCSLGVPDSLACQHSMISENWCCCSPFRNMLPTQFSPVQTPETALASRGQTRWITREAQPSQHRTSSYIVRPHLVDRKA